MISPSACLPRSATDQLDPLPSTRPAVSYTIRWDVIAENALMEQWALFAATSVETPALEILMTQADGGDRTPEGQAAIAVNAEKLRRPLARLQGHLAGAGWMVGDRFTVADINTAECLRYAQGHPSLLAEFPAVKDWLDRCQSRPAFQAMWAARQAEPA